MPSGATRSMTRAVSFCGSVSRRRRSAGYSGVSFSNSTRPSASATGRPLMESTRTSALYFWRLGCSVSGTWRIAPTTASPRRRCVLLHLAEGDVDVVRARQVPGGADEGVVVEHVEDARDGDQHVVVADLGLVPVGALAAALAVAVAAAAALAVLLLRVLVGPLLLVGLLLLVRLLLALLGLGLRRRLGLRLLLRPRPSAAASPRRPAAGPARRSARSGHGRGHGRGRDGRPGRSPSACGSSVSPAAASRSACSARWSAWRSSAMPVRPAFTCVAADFGSVVPVDWPRRRRSRRPRPRRRAAASAEASALRSPARSAARPARPARRPTRARPRRPARPRRRRSPAPRARPARARRPRRLGGLGLRRLGATLRLVDGALGRRHGVGLLALRLGARRGVGAGRLGRAAARPAASLVRGGERSARPPGRSRVAAAVVLLVDGVHENALSHGGGVPDAEGHGEPPQLVDAHGDETAAREARYRGTGGARSRFDFGHVDGRGPRAPWGQRVSPAPRCLSGRDSSDTALRTVETALRVRLLRPQIRPMRRPARAVRNGRAQVPAGSRA